MARFIKTVAADGSSSGGGAGVSSNGNGGNGGSGVIILRYPSSRTLLAGAGLTTSTSTDGGFKVTTITAGIGTITFN